MSTRHATGRPRGAALALTLLAMAALASPPPASAATPHHSITRGDVVAAFQARSTGGYVNVMRGHLTPAPVRGLQEGRINPFSSGRAYCPADWHYLGVTMLAEGGRRAAGAFLDGVVITFAVDDSRVTATMRTAVKRFVGTGVSGQYGVSVGKLLPPGSIAEGEHILTTMIAAPGLETMVQSVDFTLSEDACAA